MKNIPEANQTCCGLEIFTGQTKISLAAGHRTVSGHLGTEHMRHLGTRYSVMDISVLEISVLNNKNNLIEFKKKKLHVDAVYTYFYVVFFNHL